MALEGMGLEIAKRLLKNAQQQMYDGSILLMEILKKGEKMLKQVFASGLAIFHKDLKDCPSERIEMAFFLIAQWHNVPFQNTNILLGSCTGRRARNFKEAIADPHGHVSAQSGSQQLYREKECMCVWKRVDH